MQRNRLSPRLFFADVAAPVVKFAIVWTPISRRPRSSVQRLAPFQVCVVGRLPSRAVLRLTGPQLSCQRLRPTSHG